jgi:membrane protease YdiL (CAAX protease family)
MKKDMAFRSLAIIEQIIAAELVIFDVLIPSLLILVIAAGSLLVRREKISALGLIKAPKPWRMVLCVFGLSVAWTLIDFCLILPVLNHLTGTTQEMGGFAELKGNIGQYFFMLAAGWVLGAFAEEIAFRGYIQMRTAALFPNKTAGIVAAVALSSVLFGLLHTEQGIVGVVVTTLDAVFFSFVRLRFGGNTWASVLAHGFNNTIGITVFFFTGPLYGLW